MTLLPVVERELRVGARARSMYRARFMAAAFTVAFSVFSLWFVPVFLDDNPIPPRELFLFLTWIEFIFVCIAGFTITCDAISEEKRDATLGLLFLTDLKGYDVVLGKLCGAGVRGLYALFGTLPVLALPLMLGGTSLVELARVSLTLVLTLFLSMSVGLAVSAMLRRSWTAFGLSGMVIIFFTAILLLYSNFVRHFHRMPELAHFIEIPSPSYALLMSFDSGMMLTGNAYLTSLTVITGIALVALILAVLITPNVWKDRPAARRKAKLVQALRDLKFGSAKVRERFRRQLLEKKPILWLSRRERVSSLGLLFSLLAAGAAAGWIASRDWSRTGPPANILVPFFAWMVCCGLAHGLILLRLAVVAAERFGEDRKSGALELTLSTPISIKEVLAGHWMGLCRYFAGPIIIAFGMQLLAFFLFLNVQYLQGDYRSVKDIGDFLFEIGVHLLYAPIDSNGIEFHLAVLLMLGSIPALMLNWVALAWLSTWFSLRVKHLLAAPIAALALLHAPPWMALGMIAVFLEENDLLPNHDFSEVLVIYAIGAVLLFTHTTVCIAWSRRQLYKHFRTAATDRYQPATVTGWRAIWARVRAWKRARTQLSPASTSGAAAQS